MSHDSYLLEAWMLGAGRAQDLARAEASGWLADACEAAECAVLAAERYGRAGLGVEGFVWRDPSTRAIVSHHDALDRAVDERAKRHAESGAVDPLAVALTAARRALVLVAGWGETLAASVHQDEALYIDPLFVGPVTPTPASEARSTHTLAVAASIASKRARAAGRRGA